MSWKCKVLLWQSDTRLCSGRYWKRIVRMWLGIGGEKMELLEMLENIEIAYHDLVIKYYYASKIDKDKRKELYYQCEEEFKTLKKKLSEAESLEKKLGHSLDEILEIRKVGFKPEIKISNGKRLTGLKKPIANRSISDGKKSNIYDRCKR